MMSDSSTTTSPLSPASFVSVFSDQSDASPTFPPPIIIEVVPPTTPEDGSSLAGSKSPSRQRLRSNYSASLQQRLHPTLSSENLRNIRSFSEPTEDDFDADIIHARVRLSSINSRPKPNSSSDKELQEKKSQNDSDALDIDELEEEISKAKQCLLFVQSRLRLETSRSESDDNASTDSSEDELKIVVHNSSTDQYTESEGRTHKESNNQSCYSSPPTTPIDGCHYWRKTMAPLSHCIICSGKLGFKIVQECRKCKLILHPACRTKFVENECTYQSVKRSLMNYFNCQLLLNGGNNVHKVQKVEPPARSISQQPPVRKMGVDFNGCTEIRDATGDAAETIKRRVSRKQSKQSLAPIFTRQSSRVTLSQHRKESLSSDAWCKNDWNEVTIPLEEINFPMGSLIGLGRFGEVHRGYYYMDVAVKFMDMAYVDSESQIEKFREEATSFLNTRHDNIVLFIGCCFVAPMLGIVMNYCRGPTIYEILHVTHDLLSYNRYLSIAAQICQGMAYLHSRGIVHKDLRTKNIFLETNNKVIITDFGLFTIHRLWSQSLRQSPCERNLECKKLEVPENWLCYLGPEMARALKAPNEFQSDEDLPFSEGSDLYAFGTVWYELLTADFPFRHLPAQTILWQVGSGIKPPMMNLQNATRLAKNILMRCWSYEASSRTSFNDLFQIFVKDFPRKVLRRSPSQPSAFHSRSSEDLKETFEFPIKC